MAAYRSIQIGQNLPEIPCSVRLRTANTSTPNKMVQAMRTDPKETAPLSEMSQRDLADMVTKAQDERFKLLRAMKGFAAMQSDDAMITPATERDGPVSPETLSAELPDKLAKIDTWLNRRMADVQRAEARIDRRMAQLDRVEQSVRELTTKLDAQLNSISPDGAHTKRVQQMAWRSLSEVLDDARQQIATISRPLDDRLAVMRQAEQQLNASRDRAEAMLLEFAARFDEQSQSHADQADAQIETFSAQARQVLDRNRDLIDQAQAQVNDRVLAMQERLSERVARMKQVAAVADLKAMVDRAEEAARSLEALIELHEPTADSDLIEAELDDCAHAAGTSVLEVRPLMDQLKQTAERLRGMNDPERPASDTA